MSINRHGYERQLLVLLVIYWLKQLGDHFHLHCHCLSSYILNCLKCQKLEIALYGP